MRDPASLTHLVIIVRMQRVVYKTHYGGMDIIFIRKEREAVPGWTSHSPLHTVLHGYCDTQCIAPSVYTLGSQEMDGLRELNIVMEPVGLLFEVHKNSHRLRARGAPHGWQTVYCFIDGIDSVLHIPPWASDLLETILNDADLKLWFRSTSLTAAQLRDALTAMANTGHATLRRVLGHISYPSRYDSQTETRTPADLADLLVYGLYTGRDQRDFIELGKRFLIFDRCPSRWSLRCQHMVVPVCMPIKNTRSSEGHRRATQGHRVKLIINHMQQMKRKYTFLRPPTPAWWNALHRAAYMLCSGDINGTNRFADLWKCCTDTVREDRVVEYSKQLMDHYFNKTHL